MSGNVELRIQGYNLKTFRSRCPIQYRVLRPLLEDDACAEALEDARVELFLQALFAKYSEDMVSAVVRRKERVWWWDIDVLDQIEGEFIAENPLLVIKGRRGGRRAYPLANLFINAVQAIKETNPNAARHFRLHALRIYAIAIKKPGRRSRR